jgi:hypothetical protein
MTTIARTSHMAGVTAGPLPRAMRMRVISEPRRDFTKEQRMGVAVSCDEGEDDGDIPSSFK